MRTFARRASAVTAVVLAAALCAGQSASAQPTPGLGEVFNGYVIGTLRDGQLASPGQLFEPLRGNDPFYSEPKLTGREKPGTILKSRPVAVQFTGLRPGHLDAVSLMYVTTGVDGKPAISTGILMIPRDGKVNKDRKVIGYQLANDSVGPYCHPSSLWTGGAPLDGASWSALGPLALMLGKGYAVMMSDIGNNGDTRPHGVFAGRFAGMATLDGIRAAVALPSAGLNPRAPMGLFGVAGGGVGAAFAAEYQKRYAPELNIKSTVLEGMVVDQRNFIRTADGSIGSGFAFATLLGLEPWYPQMRIDSKLNPAGLELAKFFRTQCQTPAYFGTPFVPLRTLFKDGQNPADIADFQRVYDDNRLGGEAPKSKVLIASCAKDDSPMSLVPAQDSRNLADQYRRGGTSVTYQPTDCSMLKFLTDMYGWGTDLFGMQTISWLDTTLNG